MTYTINANMSSDGIPEGFWLVDVGGQSVVASVEGPANSRHTVVWGNYVSHDDGGITAEYVPRDDATRAAISEGIKSFKYAHVFPERIVLK